MNVCSTEKSFSTSECEIFKKNLRDGPSPSNDLARIFGRKIVDIIVPILRRDGGIIPMSPFFFSMQRSPRYRYARSDAGLTKVRQMHPGHDLKSKSTSLHQNRQATNTFIISYLSSSFPHSLFNSPSYFFFFLSFWSSVDFVRQRSMEMTL